MVDAKQFEQFVAWAKRRGVIWPASEIYGGLASTYDYGPVGVEMKNRLKAHWWATMVHERDDIVGLDSAIIFNPKVWEASGHTENFSDPLLECKNCNERYRADHLYDSLGITDPLIGVDGNFHPSSEARKLLDNYQCKKCGNRGTLTNPRQFDMMFETHIGPVIKGDESRAYLRPETAQGIFINFKQIHEVSRQKLPFGIAQIGKAFRNEITPGNFTFRTREFEQMEMEFFVKPDEATEWFDRWVEARLQWYIDLGLSPERLRLFKHPKAKLAHYSKGTTDIEYEFPWGWGELEGIANRGDFDLIQHQKFSGRDMSIFDEETKEKVTPWVIEPSGGVDRTLLALLVEAWQWHEKGRKEDGEEETVLAIDPRLAAYDAAVLPLMKKEPLQKMAAELVKKLRAQGKHVFYDESGSIGRRYRRQDEIGTPVCYTIDFESIEGATAGTVTARHRDDMTQERVSL